MINHDIIYDLLAKDTYILSPEIGITKLSPHQGLCKDKKYPTRGNVNEMGGIVTRYNEDKQYIRAYGLTTYEGGVAIIYDKTEHTYAIVTLGENDGNWFQQEEWRFNSKSNFIACLSEALSIFNANAKIND